MCRERTRSIAARSLARFGLYLQGAVMLFATAPPLHAHQVTPSIDPPTPHANLIEVRALLADGRYPDAELRAREAGLDHPGKRLLQADYGAQQA